MGRQAIKTVAILIGLFIVGAKASEWGKLMVNAGQAGSGFARTLQGR